MLLMEPATKLIDRGLISSVSVMGDAPPDVFGCRVAASMYLLLLDPETFNALKIQENRP